MIVQLKGNVGFPITLDPSVWIFDDRKVEFDQAFNPTGGENVENNENDLEQASERWNREVYMQQKIKPPVNKSLSKAERKKALESTYVMSIKPFLANAEVKDNASNAILLTEQGDQTVTIEQLENGYFLFAVEGKPLKEDGPLYFYFGDGSNKDTPIRGVKQITIE
ncbi:hypothetical protein HNQ94_003477 [Salirhabdus euzebyi]|uniref:Peptidyl-prolyl cis-trans isomerase n=1 Tax=Salirhabdus euzebyi TaxID=394506 RepID=A0A841Q9K2_9BACI|nr:hypothetical protein [Salirhabdus euzebyi]MBB6454983.1 hypothetical protein [Salirhabdus euzebyi]